MEKLTFEQFCNAMYEANDSGNHISGVIVFSQDSFTQEYNLESRSYRVSSQSKYFSSGMCGNSLFGSTTILGTHGKLTTAT